MSCCKKDFVRHSLHQKQFIVTGYRESGISPTQCIASVFTKNNETFNFWTHFVPFWYFLWVLLKTLLSNESSLQDVYLWPFLAYVSACTLFTFASAFAHLFCAVSEDVANMCFLLDYGAISLYVLSAGMAYRAYAFPLELRKTTFGSAYVNIAVLNVTVGFFVACATRYVTETIVSRILRTSAFAIPCIYDVGPIIYRFMCSKEHVLPSAHTYHWVGIAFMFLSGFLYSSRIPERFFPGCFDIIGHSHQLFHISSAIGTYAQMTGILLDLRSRRELLEPDWEFTSFSQSIGLLTTVLMANVLIVMFFHCKVSNVRITPSDTCITNASHTPSDKTSSYHTASDIASSNHTPSDITSTDDASRDITSAYHKPNDITSSNHASSDKTSSNHTPSDKTSSNHTPSDITSAYHIPCDITSAYHTSSDITGDNQTPSDFTTVRNISSDMTNANYTHSDITSASNTPSDITSAYHTASDKTSSCPTPSDITSTYHTPSDITSANHTPSNITSAYHTPSDITSANHTPSDVTSGSYVPGDIGTVINRHSNTSDGI